MSDYDQIEKLFTGSWKYDRDENVDAFMIAMEAPEDAKKMAALKPTLTMTRDGDSLKQKSVMGPGMEFEATLKLNEVLDWKDKEDSPTFHVKTLTTFKDGVIIQDTTPQKAGGGKRHISKMSVQGDELVMNAISNIGTDLIADHSYQFGADPKELSLPEGSNVTAKRFYKRC